VTELAAGTCLEIIGTKRTAEVGYVDPRGGL
jgi:hypothetical protein